MNKNVLADIKYPLSLESGMKLVDLHGLIKKGFFSKSQ